MENLKIALVVIVILVGFMYDKDIHIEDEINSLRSQLSQFRNSK